jgi:hypothetical protein
MQGLASHLAHLRSNAGVCLLVSSARSLVISWLCFFATSHLHNPTIRDGLQVCTCYHHLDSGVQCLAAWNAKNIEAYGLKPRGSPPGPSTSYSRSGRCLRAQRSQEGSAMISPGVPLSAQMTHPFAPLAANGGRVRVERIRFRVTSDVFGSCRSADFHLGNIESSPILYCTSSGCPRGRGLISSTHTAQGICIYQPDTR